MKRFPHARQHAHAIYGINCSAITCNHPYVVETSQIIEFAMKMISSNSCLSDSRSTCRMLFLYLQNKQKKFIENVAQVSRERQLLLHFKQPRVCLIALFRGRDNETSEEHFFAFVSRENFPLFTFQDFSFSFSN